MPRRRYSKEYEYWANERDSTKLAETCYEKITQFCQAASSSYHYARAARSWCYYHGLYFDDPSFSDWTAVREITDDLLGVDSNHFRNLLEHIYTIVCQQRLAFQPRITKSGSQSLQNSKVARADIEEYRRGKGVEQIIKRSVRHALVLTEGYVHYPWDRWHGKRQMPMTDEAGELVLDWDGVGRLEPSPEGDFNFSTPSIFDIVYDPGCREWERNDWLLVRTFENKYTLAAQAKNRETAYAIIDQASVWDNERDTLLDIALFNAHQVTNDDNTDVIPVWNFYHRHTLACPEGRWLRFVGDGTPIEEARSLPFERIPLSRVIPGETLLTQLGYSPANDLQGLQELLNSEMSTIATNHAGAGFSWVWKPPGSKLSEDDLGSGLFFIEGGQQPPVGGTFQANSPDHERFSTLIRKDMETLSGVNSVARGQPEASLKSGEALKVMDAKANLSVSPLRESYALLLEEVFTFVVRHKPLFMEDDEERFFTSYEDKESPELKSYRADDFDGIDGVVVDIANPIMDTVSGKMWLAEQLMSRGMITNPWEFLTLVRTGDFDKTVRAEEEQLKRVHAENDRLTRGEPAHVSQYTDNHILDIREHTALISSPENRDNAALVQNAGAHIAQHVQALLMPDVQMMMQMLGFPISQMAQMMGAPGAGVGVGPGAGQVQGPKPQGSLPPPSLQSGGEQPMAGPGGAQKRFPKEQAQTT